MQNSQLNIQNYPELPVAIISSFHQPLVLEF
ncbi:MAG: hypothetical protein ACI9NN_002277, partial [Bacteroidia bacterium]